MVTTNSQPKAHASLTGCLKLVTALRDDRGHQRHHFQPDAGSGSPSGAELMAEPMKLTLTYTEMMNGGRQQMDKAEHAREQELQQRVEDLQKDVDQLEQSWGSGLISQWKKRQFSSELKN